MLHLDNQSRFHLRVLDEKKKKCIESANEELQQLAKFELDSD